MPDFSTNRFEGPLNSSVAFVLYRLKVKGAKEEVFYNEDARRVLFPLDREGKSSPLPEISVLCSRWKEMLEKRWDEMKGSGEERNGDAGYIDFFQSWRRQYTVKGVVLSDQSGASQGDKESYLFILERFNPGGMNFTVIFRQWNLTQREQEIVRLILADKSNKEIATHLGLSLNTIKGYLKLLMRKVGAHTRGGIISILLTGQRQKPQP
jgi:DNA-binding CsgD family transcriptional regulator